MSFIITHCIRCAEWRGANVITEGAPIPSAGIGAGASAVLVQVTEPKCCRRLTIIRKVIKPLAQ